VPTVREVLGPSAYSLLRYGVSPDDEVSRAIEILRGRAPHLAEWLKKAAAALGLREAEAAKRLY